MQKYNILFATDENYLKHTAVTIVSLLEKNKELSIKIYYILDKISEENKIKLINLIKRYDCEIEFLIIDGDKFNLFATMFHFNKSVYYRLMMANVISDNSILYMDSDIVINGSIKEIFSKSFDDYYLCAVLNPKFNRYKELSMDKKAKYFNAGLLYVNLKKWREDAIFEKCVEYMDINFKNIELADQDVLNAVINGRWRILEPKYNQQAVLFNKDFNNIEYEREEIKEAIENPIVVHYSGSLKPWHFRNNHPYKHLYWKYLRMTPFKRYIPEDFTVMNLIKWIIPNKFKSSIKLIFKK